MDVREKVIMGDYNTKISPSLPDLEVDDNTTLGQIKCHKQKKDDQKRNYLNDIYRLHKQFQKDLAAENHMLNHPKENLLFKIACEKRENNNSLISVIDLYEQLLDLIE